MDRAFELVKSREDDEEEQRDIKGNNDISRRRCWRFWVVECIVVLFATSVWWSGYQFGKRRSVEDSTIRYVPRVVVVCAMASELERWIERLPLPSTLSFPGGSSELRWSEELGILGVATGEGSRRASVSITALGYDNRFDLRLSYWMFAGIAGVDPQYGSIGSAFWARAVVHADSGNMFDSREIPDTFDGTTILPSNRDKPFGLPTPSPSERVDMAYDLSRLAEFAYNLTKDVVLEDSDKLRAVRAQYSGPASLPPVVRMGNAASSDLFWAGEYMTQWARDWDAYWNPHGKDKFATTAMEDSALALALNCLSSAGRANASRLLVLRTASDYSAQPPSVDLVEWFYAPDRHFAMDPSLEAAYVVGSVVALHLSSTNTPM